MNGAQARSRTVTLALVGNPNAGKTTIFNVLTGSHQHVGNWPGKTVERREGRYDDGDLQVQVIDLPGAYSLTPHTPEEAIARDFLLESAPDMIVAVLDAANLERNLYIVVQLLEWGRRLVIALNMSDQAQQRGLQIDPQRLSEALGGVPVVPTVAARGTGLDALRLEIRKAASAAEPAGSPDPARLVGRAKEVGAEPFLPGNGMRRAAPGGAPVERWPPSLHIDYGPDIESALSQLSDAVRQGPDGEVGETPRWLGLKLLEGERESVARVGPARNDLLIMAREATQRLAEAHPEGLPLVIADRRYQFIHQLGQLILRRPSTQRPTLTDRVDAIVTHTWLGLPLFLVVMYLVFGLVVGVSRPLVDWIGATISGPIAHWVYELADWLHAPSWLSSLAGEGIIGGVGGVLVFVPVLGLLFLFISVLEDSGYMARAAFLMNRLMSFVGLHGKSFVPLILGFGCGVPAIYATRTLESRRDRTLTALLVPMMSCSARLPVYMVFVLAFFTGRAQLVIWALYALGVTVAIAGGMVFSRILFRSVRKAPFLMELPPYRLPRARNLWRAVSTRLHHFLRQASTVILSVSVLVWVLTHLPWGVNSLEASWFGNLSARLAPAFRPAGFGTWQAAGSLVTGFVAKELVVSTMTQIYLADGGSAPHASQPNVLAELRSIAQGLFVALGEAGKETLELLTPGWKLFPSQGGGQDPALVGTLRQTFTPASALAFVVFVLVYVPCAATLAAIRHEFGARWAAFSAAYQTILAWVLAVAVYHGARWIGIG